jgi:glycine/D-amino acid oxidase-like deaminating enzyme
VAVGSAGAVVETERGTIRAGVLVVASDGRELTLVPEIARLVRVATARALRGAAAAEAALPFAVRTADGRIAWQAREGRLSLLETGFEEARPSAALTLLAKLPMAPGSLRDHTEDVVMTLDGLPVVGRLPGRPLAVLTGLLPNPVSLAFAGARWVADALRTGSDPTPTPLRPTRPKLGPGV